MNKNNLIKNTLIIANILELMRVATNKGVAVSSELIGGEGGNFPTSSEFHAATLLDILNLKTLPEELVNKEQDTPEENDESINEKSTEGDSDDKQE